MDSTRPSSFISGDQPLLALRNATKSYGGVRVLEIDDLELNSGDRISLLGPNASGKSTLLRLLAGIAYPTSGSVARSPALERLRVGYLPEAGGIAPDMTVAQNLGAVARLYDEPEGFCAATRDLVVRFGLEPFLGIPVRELSSGFRKITGIAAILGAGPDVLFLDEPFNGLDAAHAALLGQVIDALSTDVALLVITGHEGSEPLSGTRRIELQAGRIR